VDAAEEPDTLLSPNGLLRFGQEASAWFPNNEADERTSASTSSFASVKLSR